METRRFWFISAHESCPIDFSVYTYIPHFNRGQKVFGVRRTFTGDSRMQLILVATLLSVAFGSCSASIAGPFIFWGHQRVTGLQSQALVDSNSRELPLTQLFTEAKAIVVFVRNSTNRLEGIKYPRFQNLVKSGAWTYLPQRSLAAEPFGLNANIEVVSLSGHGEEDDSEILSAYNEALNTYGRGEVLGILASREEEAHFLAKREASPAGEEEEKDKDKEKSKSAEGPEETEASFIYVAEGNKAVLSLNGPLELRLTNDTLKLEEHIKQITFDDQRAKGYGRLSITFMHSGEKCTLRFKFSLIRGSWTLRNVEVEYRDLKSVLVARGDEYTLPNAPLGFSYRCSAENVHFLNPQRNETIQGLILTDFQVQPWLNGRPEYGEVYDCVGFVSAPILAGLFVVTLLLGILGLGISAMLSMHTPNRFESSRSKQLTFTIQE
ncbi:uncharacterized protein VhaAC45RP isoform X1 [Drosophila takahashii]|uniref:uncharacterized protein VhaAC45RP isoform X1 n=1 Tax=Drosophila takahashii TaxID=29030 RepID=UPI001CF847A7|nr:uncharacterized protein LOC108065325 isoform X1 [Drosophila takahashii]